MPGLRAFLFRSWDPLGTMASLVDRWKPPTDPQSEESLEAALHEFLTAELPHCRVTRQYGHDRIRADIVIEGVVAIELKFALSTGGDYQRLIGQIEEYARWGIRFVVVLVKSVDQDFARRVREHVERRFNSLQSRVLTKDHAS